MRTQPRPGKPAARRTSKREASHGDKDDAACRSLSSRSLKISALHTGRKTRLRIQHRETSRNHDIFALPVPGKCCGLSRKVARLDDVSVAMPSTEQRCRPTISTISKSPYTVEHSLRAPSILSVPRDGTSS